MKIQTLLFDLGNVLLYFSHERMYQQMGEVLGLPAAGVQRLLTEGRCQWRYEAGQLTTAALLELLGEHATRPFAPGELLHAASDIFTPNAAMLPVLRGLKARGIRLVLVSNTCEAHMDFAAPRFECFRYFDALVYSYAVRAMKPDAAFYAAAAQRAGCPPEACLFTDDLAENVEGARAFGFDAVRFTGAEAFVEALASRGLDRLVDQA